VISGGLAFSVSQNRINSEVFKPLRLRRFLKKSEQRFLETAIETHRIHLFLHIGVGASANAGLQGEMIGFSMIGLKAQRACLSK